MPPNLIGSTLSHFRITAKLGEGGMGEVYRAEDTKLGRDVAIKVLPEEMAEDPERLERFRREAKTLAAMSHPNIAAVFALESADFEFLVMELIDGKTLDTLLPSTGLPLDRFLEFATPIADALASAHGHGIVHRDLKPTNVMVTNEGQRVKVLDFGLAKLTETVVPDGSTQLPTEALTQEGIVVGTPQYMSPEQAKGEAVDQRSDIFSLGVMLYEMATGERPFQGKSSVELLSAVLKDPPPSVSDVKPELPRHLGRVIGRCLEKAPIDRYQTARDVFNELKTLLRETGSGTRQATAIRSGSDSQLRRAQAEAPWIAVVPFSCRSADPELEEFADGLTEEITTSLSRFSHLLVISKTSTEKLRTEVTDVRQLGQELGSPYVIEGSLRKGGTKVRLSVQLLEAQTGTHLWAETFDRDLASQDAFELQDELTDRIVATVADPFGVLIRSMAAPAAAKPPEELTPYEALLRSFLYRQRIQPEEHRAVRTALERTVGSEPDYAEAWAALAAVYVEEHVHDFNPRPDPLGRALAAARKAVDKDPTCQLGFMSLAEVQYFSGDIGAFRSSAERAIRLNPRDNGGIALMGILFGYAGDWDRGVELTTRAMDRNPHHPGWYHFTTFFNEYRQKRFDRALEIAQRINMPEYWGDPLARTLAHAQLGNLPAARAAAEELCRAFPDFEARYKRVGIDPWMYAQPELAEQILDGLAKAGLEMVVDDAAT